MKNILVLGASSVIGSALGKRFSKGNRVILSGRNYIKLKAVAEKCRESGATDVEIVLSDLAKSIQPIIDINLKWPIDLIIDSASAASMFRDEEIKPEEISILIKSDLISHLYIFQKLLRLNNTHPDIIYVSSVLAKVKTPGREFYSLTKRMTEMYLEKIIKLDSGTRITIFRIGKLIAKNQDNRVATEIASKVWTDFFSGNTIVNYGLGGHILLSLNIIHPVTINFVIKIQRFLRSFRK
jgi:short-subunit dehydrogenase